jgi:hypothetical protein
MKTTDDSISEVRNDYTDDDNYTHIDIWLSADDSEEGKSVAIVDNDSGKVFYIDNTYRLSNKVKEAIEEVKNRVKS